MYLLEPESGEELGLFITQIILPDIWSGLYFDALEHNFLVVIANSHLVLPMRILEQRREAHLIFHTRDLRFFHSFISAWPARPGLAPMKLLRAAWGVQVAWLHPSTLT